LNFWEVQGFSWRKFTPEQLRSRFFRSSPLTDPEKTCAETAQSDTSADSIFGLLADLVLSGLPFFAGVFIMICKPQKHPTPINGAESYVKEM
jgi:hypothetical protein